MVVNPNRGCTMIVPRGLVVGIGWADQINTSKPPKGKKGRRKDTNESERERRIDAIGRQVTDAQIREKIPEVIDYLNRTSCLLTPIKRLVIQDENAL